VGRGDGRGFAQTGHRDPRDAAVCCVLTGAVDSPAQASLVATHLQCSIYYGHQQAAQVLRQLERAARRGKAAATSECGQQAGRQDTPEAREAAERMGAALIEEEEREEAQRKVRGVELPPVYVR
jgi:hypothetical protein